MKTNSRIKLFAISIATLSLTSIVSCGTRYNAEFTQKKYLNIGHPHPENSSQDKESDLHKIEKKDSEIQPAFIFSPESVSEDTARPAPEQENKSTSLALQDLNDQDVAPQIQHIEHPVRSPNKVVLDQPVNPAKINKGEKNKKERNTVDLLYLLFGLTSLLLVGFALFYWLESMFLFLLLLSVFADALLGVLILLKSVKLYATQPTKKLKWQRNIGIVLGSLGAFVIITLVIGCIQLLTE